MEWQNPRLVQCLLKPINAENPFAFGCGKIHGGFDDKAWKVLKQICRFDYMGAAEFENGAVPEALYNMAEMRYDNQLEKFSFDLEISHTYHRKDKSEIVKKTFTFYAICPTVFKDNLIDFVRKCANGTVHQLKVSCNLYEALWNPYNFETENNKFGWLELYNGFMFFIDETMYKNMCRLFEL